MTDEEFQGALEAARRDERHTCALIAEVVADTAGMKQEAMYENTSDGDPPAYLRTIAATARYIAWKIREQGAGDGQVE